ncbi:MAG: replicative DNA helicase [Bdellovibrionales bacterium]|nr:replicative DNA helicase [Bdellovibrionales bacterium]
MNESQAVPASQRKRLPHDLEAERSVLGAVLVNNNALDQVREIGAEARDFFLDPHQKIYEMACTLSDTGRPIDIVTLTGALRDRGWYDHVGGINTLTSLFDQASFQVANVAHYGKMVREKALQRRLIEACSEIMDEGLQGVESTEAFIDTAETKIFQVSQNAVQKSFASLAEVVSENMNRVQELYGKSAEVIGLETGFVDLDRMTTGLHPGQVMIIAARPGMGKTSWFISALLHSAVVQKKVAALFSLEMSKEEMGFRFFSSLSRIDSKSIKTGQLSREQFRRLMAAAEQLGQAGIHIDDTAALTVMDLRARCRRLKAKEKRLDLIVVDYLQLMRGSKSSSSSQSSREQEISAISRGLKELSKELKVPIIALSQLSRQVENRTDKRPQLSDLRESGAIEQDADMVCFIYRDDYYNKDSDEKGIAEFIVAKNRHGEPGTVKLAWMGQYTLFANLTSDGQAQPSSSGAPVIRKPNANADDFSL